MTTSVSPAATRPFAMGLAAIAGLALGVLTVVGQDVLPGLVVGIANSAVVWSLLAFVAGALADPRSRRRAPARPFWWGLSSATTSLCRSSSKGQHRTCGPS